MTTIVDLRNVKSRQQATWATGDYGVIGTTLQITGEQLAEACDLRTDEAVLDVAAGNGNASLAAARRGCRVTCTDYVGPLLDQARERIAADRLAATFKVADAEALPFDDGTFDVVLSTFGAMFTPDQVKAAGELARVCRPGGRIGMTNWTPDSFVGQMFKTIARHLPPPAGVPSPMSWGITTHIRSLFGDSAAAVDATPRHFHFRYRSAEHFVEVFRQWYGPVRRAFESLPAESGAVLAHDLVELARRFSRADDRTLVVPSEYLEVVIARR